MPLYNYKECATYNIECIARAASASQLNVQLIISDDSDSPLFSRTELISYSSSFLDVSFVHNKVPLGASMNWNSLLMRAEGKFIWFIHHDEYIYSSGNSRMNSLVDLFFRISLAKEDVIILPAYRESRFARHLLIWKVSPFRLIQSYFAFHPALLFYANVLGSPSRVIAKKAIAEAFDDKLSWLIDVAWYVELFRSSQSISFVDLPIVTTSSFQMSITNTIGNSNIKPLKMAELSYIKGATFNRFSFYMLQCCAVVMLRLLRIVQLPIFSECRRHV